MASRTRVIRPLPSNRTILINAWGYEGDASRAEIVLQQMQDDYLQGTKRHAQ
jgi:hypothetical protein